MRLLTIMIYLGMLFFVKAFASDSEASEDCPLTYNGITQRIQTILASHQPSFSSSQVQKKDKGYIAFLLKNEFKAEKGNPGYSPRYYEIIVELFLLNETEYLRLLWWETEDSTTRLLIMSLFMCQDGDMDAERRIASFYVPSFASYCERFQSDEAHQRLKEVQLLQDNIVELRHKLRPIITHCKRNEGV